jgi:hypothetical protein
VGWKLVTPLLLGADETYPMYKGLSKAALTYRSLRLVLFGLFRLSIDCKDVTENAAITAARK